MEEDWCTRKIKRVLEDQDDEPYKLNSGEGTLQVLYYMGVEGYAHTSHDIKTYEAL